MGRFKPVCQTCHRQHAGGVFRNHCPCGGMIDMEYELGSARIRPSPNPLLRFFDLKFVSGAVTVHFDVGSATYESGSGVLRVTVTGSGTPLSIIPNDGSALVSLHPRFYRVKTDGILDVLPSPASIQIEFQATTANSVGQPDESPTAVTPWTSDVAVLNSNPNNPLFRFFRFRVTFDLGLTELSADTPVPALDYLRVPFRF